MALSKDAGSIAYVDASVRKHFVSGTAQPGDSQPRQTNPHRLQDSSERIGNQDAVRHYAAPRASIASTAHAGPLQGHMQQTQGQASSIFSRRGASNSTKKVAKENGEDRNHKRSCPSRSGHWRWATCFCNATIEMREIQNGAAATTFGAIGGLERGRRPSHRQKEICGGGAGAVKGGHH